MTFGPVRSLGLVEAAALLRIHPHTLRERARAGLNYAHRTPGYVAQYVNNVRKK